MEKYIIKSQTTFRQKGLEDKGDLKQSEKEQAPASGEVDPMSILFQQIHFKFYKMDEDHIAFIGTLDFDSMNLSEFDEETRKSIQESKTRKLSLETIFQKTSTEHKYKPIKYVVKEDGKIIEETEESSKIFHISISNDKSAISFLSLEQDDEFGEELVMLQFIQTSLSYADVGNKKYNFLEGPGVKVKWNTKQEKEISICGKQSEFLILPISRALDEWQSALGKPLNFSIKLREHYKPFSDLNQNCIFYVKKYRLETSKKKFFPAATIGARNYFTGDIVSSNIFFFEEELLVDFRLKESYRPDIHTVYQTIIRPEYKSTYFKNEDMKSEMESISSYIFKDYFVDNALHEFGHFLGIDHIFDGTPSIMSYRNSDGTLTEYDKAAINELYN